MSERIQQKDFSYVISGDLKPNVVAHFSIFLNDKNEQEETLLMIGKENTEIFRPTLEVIYSKDGLIDMKRPGVNHEDSDLPIDQISIPESVKGLLPLIEKTERKSKVELKNSTNKERTEYVQSEVAKSYPVTIYNNLIILPHSVSDLSRPQKITSFAADE